MEIPEKIHLALPKVNNLWFRQEGMAQLERVKMYEKLAKIEERAKELISEGKMGGDDRNELFDWVGVTDGLEE
ncbi:hypothetical protein VKT23_000078 [Stygiomarasmius scandens]|uniref:Uncharacterized protein n=1 Tax=Marasmiellus scandens TaxID=2682957 RepID=A0ABR1K5N2_9AGAR